MLKASITHTRSLLQDVPEGDLPDNPAEFWEYVAWELSQLITFATQAEQPEITFAKFRKAGEQYIWEFWLNDLALPKKEQYNWHGQNTSQWKYAGAIALQSGHVTSCH